MGRPVVMFCYVFFWKFLLPIGLHSCCSLQMVEHVKKNQQNIMTVDAPQCSSLEIWLLLTWRDGVCWRRATGQLKWQRKRHYGQNVKSKQDTAHITQYKFNCSKIKLQHYNWRKSKYKFIDWSRRPLQTTLQKVVWNAWFLPMEQGKLSINSSHPPCTWTYKMSSYNIGVNICTICIECRGTIGYWISKIKELEKVRMGVTGD